MWYSAGQNHLVVDQGVFTSSGVNDICCYLEVSSETVPNRCERLARSTKGTSKAIHARLLKKLPMRESVLSKINSRFRELKAEKIYERLNPLHLAMPLLISGSWYYEGVANEWLTHSFMG